MTERWQNTDFRSPGYQDICRDECAIDDPQGSIITRARVMGDDYWQRGEAFGFMRMIIAEGGTKALEALAHGAVVDDSAIQEAASSCVVAIKDGHCPRYVHLEDVSFEGWDENFTGIMRREFYEKESIKEE